MSTFPKKKHSRRSSDSEALAGKRSQPAANGDDERYRRRTNRPVATPDEASRKGAVNGNGNDKKRKEGVRFAQGKPRHRRSSSFSPLTRWPPTGLPRHEDLSEQHAFDLIARGAPAHRGRRRPVPHVSDRYYALYASTTGTRSGESDAANVRDTMTQLMTLKLQSSGPSTHPWETLEQPSYFFFYGDRPGTITLIQWVAMSSVLPETVPLRDSGVKPRDVSLEVVLGRLKDLQAGLEEDDPRLMYRNLYKKLLKDPDRILRPHKSLDKQITDLILALSRPEWIDFTDPKNQVVTRFIFDPVGADPSTYHTFFHQLLLSMELELRIHSRYHGDWAKEKLLLQIPPTIQWNLAIARRWKENVRVDGYGALPSQTKLRYKLKKRQVKVMKRFAEMMKWPNLAATIENLRQKDEAFQLDSISSDAFAFFSGLVVPGPTYPFLVMNTLIDLDPDEATDDLALLSHMYPQCGFQYRSSYTYWSASCIVGKVLAPTCHCIAGWVGPGSPTVDLGRSQIARIRSRRPKQQLGAEDVESMAERSGPLGPPAQAYPVREYFLPKTDPLNVTDTVRMELLRFKPAAVAATSGPQQFDATVQFAVDGVSWPMRLMYDVSFISAWPCSDGPHPLFFDYIYQAVKVDEIMNVRDWGGLHGTHQPGMNGAACAVNNGGHPNGYTYVEEIDDEKVLVVEAFGVSDNEVLARAWCSHWGLNAVVADVHKTCMSCAIREAYAATVTVVILVEGQGRYKDE